MDNEASKLNWLEPEEKQRAILILAGAVIFVSCLILSNAIMPENCLLYEYRQVGFLCDGFVPNVPTPCPICTDESSASTARYIFLFGCAMFLIAPVVSWLRKQRARISKPLSIATSDIANGDKL
jgi:hypothetical protein